MPLAQLSEGGVTDPETRSGTALFKNALKRPVGKASATYPDDIQAGYNTVVYIESATDSNDLCYSDEWARTDNVTSDYRDKWWLCYYMAKYRYAVEDVTTAATLAAETPNMPEDEYIRNVVLPYLSASLGPGYLEYNTCQYIPMASNTNRFIRTLSEAKQVDCLATDANAGTRAILTSCDVAFFSETDQRTSYFDTRPREWDFRCILDGGESMIKRANDSYILDEFYGKPSSNFDYCIDRK